MTVVISVINRTRGTHKFVGKLDGFLCDVDSLTDAHIYTTLVDAHDEVREFLLRPNIQMGNREMLDPVISNVCNLVPGNYNEVDFQFCRLFLEPAGEIHARIDEAPDVPISYIV